MDVEFKAVEPEVWKPVEGDSIQGALISKETDVGVNKSKAYHLENAEGQWMVWGSAILDDRMKFAKVGDIIRITYKGQTKNKKNQDVNIHKLEIGTPVAQTAA